MKIISNLFVVVRTLLSYFFIIFIVIVLAFPLLFILLFFPSDNNRFVFFLLDLIYKSILIILFVPKKIIGRENVPKDPAIIVGNHQSAIDIPVIGSLMRKSPHTWYTLVYYTHVFFLGFFVRRLGIPVSRSRESENGARALIEGIKFAQHEQGHVIIFPEGGRFNDGKVHEFWKGFVLLARLSKRPVVPIFMPYNGIIRPPSSFWNYWHQLVVVIGPHFYYQENDTDEIFAQRVYTWFVQENKKYNK